MALIDKASLLMVPSTYEAGKLYNVLPSGNRAPDSTGENSGYDQTRADFDFDRGSNTAATRVNADGLIEKYRENLLLQSNQFDTTWLNYRTTAVGNQSGYDGSNNAWLLTCTNADGNAYQDISLSGVLTFSYYVKAGSVNWTRLRIDSTTTPDLNAWINLTDGSIGTDNGIATYVESVGNGWYRIVGQTNTTGTQRVQIYPSDSDTNNSSSGSIYIQNAQLESGLVSSDYLNSTSVTGKAGVLIDLPRIDYSSGAGALLLEPSRQQLLPQTEYFGASWFASNIAVTTNAATSPEGLQNATTIENTSASNYLVYSAGVSASTNYVFSFYAKNIDATAVNVIFYDASNSAVISTTAYEDDLTTSWKRLDFLVSTPVGCTTLNVNIANGLSGSLSIYGAQLEAGSYSTSYIPNHGESGGVTRAADSCSVTGASDVIGQTEGTLYFEADIDDIANAGGYSGVLLSDGTSSNQIYITFYDTGRVQAVSIVSGSIVVNISDANYGLTAGTHKFAVAYKANDYVFYIDGSSVGSDTTATVPATNKVDLFFTSLGSLKYKEATLFNERLSNAELATLTTL